MIIDFNRPPFSYLLRRFDQWTLIDVGAFNGAFALSFIDVLPDAECHLFEPAAGSFKQLTDKCPVHFKLHNLALSNRTSVDTLLVNEAMPFKTSLHKLASDAFSVQRTQEIRLDTLDNIFSGQKIAGQVFLKIDAEGSDLAVLEGAEELIRSVRPIILIELIFYEEYEGQATPESIIRFLSSMGYSLQALDQIVTNEAGLFMNCDALFLPMELAREMHAECNGSKETRWYRTLQQDNEIEIFKSTAEDRLNLIHQMDDECKKRQKIIEELSGPGSSK